MRIEEARESFAKAQMTLNKAASDAPQLLDESDSSEEPQDVLGCSPPRRPQQPMAANDVDLKRRVLPLVTLGRGAGLSLSLGPCVSDLGF